MAYSTVLLRRKTPWVGQAAAKSGSSIGGTTAIAWRLFARSSTDCAALVPLGADASLDSSATTTADLPSFAWLVRHDVTCNVVLRLRATITSTVGGENGSTSKDATRGYALISISSHWLNDDPRHWAAGERCRGSGMCEFRYPSSASNSGHRRYCQVVIGLLIALKTEMTSP